LGYVGGNRKVWGSLAGAKGLMYLCSHRSNFKGVFLVSSLRPFFISNNFKNNLRRIETFCSLASSNRKT
jgi:hypothetical protein